MKKILSTISAISILALFLALTACSNKAQSGAALGGLAGATAGALLGQDKNKEQNALIGLAGGALLGYLIGNEVDKNDERKLNSVYESGKSGETVAWKNPDTNNEYAVTPQTAYRRGRTWCRDAQINAIIDGKQQPVNATACRQPNGTWKMVNREGGREYGDVDTRERRDTEEQDRNYGYGY